MFWIIESPALILLGGMLLVALSSVVTKTIIFPLLGIEWPFRRVRAPWRFSLFSVTVLVTLAAAVLALLRDTPAAAMVGLTIVSVTWVSVVRYVAFRRALADRRHRELATALEAREHHNRTRQDIDIQ